MASKPAQAMDVQVIVERGVREYQAGRFVTAIAQWQQALPQINATNNLEHRTIVLENLARAHRQIGDFSASLADWEQVVQLYQHQGDRQALGRALTEQAQVYGQLGQHRQAIALLCGEDSKACADNSALQLARSLNDGAGEAAALGSLGEAYRVTGNYFQAQQQLEESLALLEADPSLAPYQAAILNSLGNTYSAQFIANARRAQAAAERGDLDDEQRLFATAATQQQQAIELLQRSASMAQYENAPLEQMRSQLNLIPLYNESAQISLAQQTWNTVNR